MEANEQSSLFTSNKCCDRSPLFYYPFYLLFLAGGIKRHNRVRGGIEIDLFTREHKSPIAPLLAGPGRPRRFFRFFRCTRPRIYCGCGMCMLGGSGGIRWKTGRFLGYNCRYYMLPVSSRTDGPDGHCKRFLAAVSTVNF